jgi:hypothetical protein
MAVFLLLGRFETYRGRVLRERRLYAGHRKECGYLNGVSVPDLLGNEAGKREWPSRENE